jgi:hypothetical protein
MQKNKPSPEGVESARQATPESLAKVIRERSRFDVTYTYAGSVVTRNTRVPVD